MIYNMKIILEIFKYETELQRSFVNTLFLTEI